MRGWICLVLSLRIRSDICHTGCSLKCTPYMYNVLQGKWALLRITSVLFCWNVGCGVSVGCLEELEVVSAKTTRVWSIASYMSHCDIIQYLDSAVVRTFNLATSISPRYFVLYLVTLYQ